MNVLTLTSTLNAIWYINNTEDENKQPIVERRDVKGLVERFFSEGACLSSIPDIVIDNSIECEVDEVIPDKDGAFDSMWLTCNKKGQLTLDDVIQSQLDGAEFDIESHYIDLCHRVGVALDIDTSENETNPTYWNTAWDDGLSPYFAVVSSVN